MKIGSKINILVAVMSLLAFVIGAISTYAVYEFQRKGQNFSIASERAQKGQILNRLVTAVDLESRGLYASEDSEEAKPFAEALRSNISLMENVLAEWKPLVPEAQMPAFVVIEEHFAVFKRFRAETASLAIDISPKLANSQGNNPVNLKNRNAYQAQIDAIVASDIEELAVVRGEMESFGNTVLMTVISVTLVGILLGVAFGLYVGNRQLSLPIRRVSSVMRELADGHLDTRIPFLGCSDEIGEMASAVEIFKKNAVDMVRMNAQEATMRSKSEDLQNGMSEVVNAAAEGDFTRRIEKDYGDDNLNSFASKINQLLSSVDSGVAETSRVIRSLANGDLTKQMEGSFQGAFAELQENVNDAVCKLADTLSQVNTTTITINKNSDELRSAAHDLSRRTEQQAAALEETSAALDQITSVVRNSTERAHEASLMVTEAKEKTVSSALIVGDAVTAMGRIEQASNEISQIINVIDEIAFQTNLLALNAGVEAARAGDAGKGFAVVAQEVRELAQRSARAAKDIKSLIARSGEEVKCGVALVQKTGIALDEIQSRVITINDNIHTIATASKEQSLGLQEVSVAMNQMDQVTQSNAAMVEESSSATQKLTAEASQLVRLVGRFVLSENTSVRHVGIVQVKNSADHIGAHSPARAMIADVSRVFSGNSARNLATDSWRDF